jgi:hypothetical protein
MKAFPLSFQWDENHKHNNGMELRDYFAAKAMQGLLATVKGEEWDYDDVSFLSYGMADEMMKAREKNES